MAYNELKDLLRMLNFLYGTFTKLQIVDGNCASYNPFTNTISLGKKTIIKNQDMIDWILCHEYKHSLDHAQKKRIIKIQKKITVCSILFWSLMFFSIINPYSFSFLAKEKLLYLNLLAIIPYFLIMSANSKYALLNRSKLKRINHFLEHRCDVFATRITGKVPEMAAKKWIHHITTFTHPSWVDRIEYLIKRFK